MPKRGTGASLETVLYTPGDWHTDRHDRCRISVGVFCIVLDLVTLSCDRIRLNTVHNASNQDLTQTFLHIVLRRIVFCF